MFRGLAIFIGYFIGCFQTAYLVGKFMNNIDIRQHGSGNAGSTNVLRVMGAKAGAITFVGDLLKAVIGFAVCGLIFQQEPVLAGLYGGIGVVVGHNWPVFLNFKGGKGIAATIGLLLAFDWKLALIAFAVAIVFLGATRYVSLASMVMSVMAPILMVVFGYSVEIIILGGVLMVSALYRHKTNIDRLLKGTESKLGQKPEKKAEDKKL